MVMLNSSMFGVEAEIIKKIAGEREYFISVLADFAETDTLLYLPDNLAINTLKDAMTAIGQANVLSGTSFVMVKDFSVVDVNGMQREKMKSYLRRLADEELAVLYLAATELRSVLLGILFVEGKASADTVFRLAFCEELEQQKQWGIDETVIIRQKDIKLKLKKWEMFCNERSLFKN